MLPVFNGVSIFHLLLFFLFVLFCFFFLFFCCVESVFFVYSLSFGYFISIFTRILVLLITFCISSVIFLLSFIVCKDGLFPVFVYRPCIVCLFYVLCSVCLFPMFCLCSTITFVWFLLEFWFPWLLLYKMWLIKDNKWFIYYNQMHNNLKV